MAELENKEIKTNEVTELMGNLLGKRGMTVRSKEQVEAAQVAESQAKEKEESVEVVGSKEVIDDKEKVVEESKEKEIIKDDSSEIEKVDYEGSLKDVNDKVKNLFGYDNIDDFLKSNAAKKLKEYDELVQAIDSLKKENEGLYSEFGGLNNPFTNNETYRLNKLLSENEGMSFDVASKLVAMDDNVDDVQKILLAERIENPDLSEREIKRVISKRFGVDNINELYDLEEDDKLDLEISAKRASRTLAKTLGEKSEMPEKYLPEDVRKKVEERAKAKEEAMGKLEETWKPVASYIKDNFNEMAIPVFDKNKEVTEYSKYVLSDEDKQKASELAIQFAKTLGLSELNKDTIQAANTHIYQTLLAEKLPRIIQIAVDKARTDTIEAEKKERDNPSADKANGGKKPNLGKVDKRDAFLDAFGIKRK